MTRKNYDYTSKRRQQRRREALKKAAQAHGFESWSKFETAVINQNIEMDIKMNAVSMIERYDFDVIVNMMDDDIREKVHAELAPTSDEKFLERYIELHKEKFNETFAIN